MADNVTLPGTGVVISTDDVGSGVEVQRVKVQYGPDGTATDVDTATGLPVKGGYLEVSGTAAANNTDATSTDVAGYRWVQVQLTGTWSATVTFQASMDNTNWVSVMLSRVDASANGTSTSTTNNIYAGVLSARYFRVRTTAYTSGTVSATVGFSVHPGWSPASAVKVSGQDNFGSSDGVASGYAFGTLALNDIWNGTTYDRWRSVTSAKNTTGLGIPAVGATGFDGTNYQAVKTTTAGDQSTVAGYVEFSGSAAANNTDLVSQDVSLYRNVSVQVTGTWSATLTFQWSNDNSNWVLAQLLNTSSTSNVPTSTASANALFVGPVQGRYFRVRTTTYASGTANVVVGFSGAPANQSTVPVNVQGASNLGDGMLASNNLFVGALNYAYNGSNYDRVRSLGVTGVAGVTPTPGTTGGWTPYSNTALSNTVQSVKSSAGTFGGYMIFNSNTAVAYVQVWNVASGSVTVGTTAPTYTLPIPAGSAANMEITCGINHSTAISVAATTTATGSTAPTTALNVFLFYK